MSKTTAVSRARDHLEKLKARQEKLIAGIKKAEKTLKLAEAAEAKKAKDAAKAEKAAAKKAK